MPSLTQLHNPAQDDFNLSLEDPEAFFDMTQGPLPSILQDDNYLQQRCQNYNRMWLCRQYSWAIPDREAVELTAAQGPIVESGAGAGYWAYLLSQLNCPIQAFDPFPASQANNGYCHRDVPSWFPVADQNSREYRQALANPDNALLLCWPRYDEPDATDALRAYAGDRLIYIGEPPGSCTADADFFATVETEWELLQTHVHPRWFGYPSSLKIFRRRRT